ncbi:hypothetical protein LRB11_16510 [Ectothiorhodospira haloalkaliphila]|uniref:hypothetical protein n=1 Tax=Ectothiorhodospira haloalkaliphila TaxID=421628 RepID=UPI001EE8AD6E|nr:hypothetical protein [Ectothiorhodospira haloalkaliphila]MCG5526507.1 hypothetical protein [Ectothiorhodospira haloalkaliphila]
MEWFLIVVLAGAAFSIEQARSEPVIVAEYAAEPEASDSHESPASTPVPAPLWPACDGSLVYRNLTIPAEAATFWLPDGRQCVPGARPEAAP